MAETKSRQSGEKPRRFLKTMLAKAKYAAERVIDFAAQPTAGGRKRLDSELVNAISDFRADSTVFGKVEQLLGKGASPNARNKEGESTLMLAAFNGYTEIFNLLIGRNANVNAKTREGWTVLMYFAVCGKTESCSLVLDKGADINARNKDNETALMLAAKSGHADVCRLLIRSGADISIENKGKRTALMLAENRNDAEIAGILNYYEYYSKKHYFKKLHDS